MPSSSYSAANRAAQDFQVVLDSRLGQLALVKREKRARLGCGVRHIDQTSRMSVTDGGLQILALLV